MKTSSLSSLSTIWVGEQSNLDVYSAKILREILCPNCGQAKFSHPAHYIHTHLHLSVTLHIGGGLRELNMHINNEHDRHIVLIKS